MKPTLYFQNPYQKTVESLFALVCGGLAAYSIQLLIWDNAYWVLSVCGAVCFCFLYRLCAAYPRSILPLRALTAALFFTTVELIAGCWLNLNLGLNLWDYSSLPLHFMGQICLSSTLVWFLLCFPLAGISRLIRRKVFLCNE